MGSVVEIQLSYFVEGSTAMISAGVSCVLFILAYLDKKYDLFC